MMKRHYPPADRPSLHLLRWRQGEQTYLAMLAPSEPIVQKMIMAWPEVFYHAGLQTYLLPEKPGSVKALLAAFRDKVWLDIRHCRKHPQGADSIVEEVVKMRVLDIEHLEAVEKVCREMTVLRYSRSTVDQYRSILSNFLKYFKGRALAELSMEDVIDYNQVMILDRGRGESAQRQLTGALKHLFQRLTDTSIDCKQLEYARKSRFLPTVLDQEEVLVMVRKAKNDKHRVIILTLYAQGLRRQELIDLRLDDIDFRRKTIHVRSAKGAKDRIVPLSEVLLRILDSYLASFHPKEYLLNGQDKLQYSGSSISKVVKRAAQEAGITKRVTPHTLRHSYATHCLEMGLALPYIQSHLGHHSITTTMRYTHIRKDKGDINPLDEISKRMMGEDRYEQYVTKGAHIPSQSKDMLT